MYTGVIGQQQGTNLYRRTQSGSIISVAEILAPAPSGSTLEYSIKSLVSGELPEKEVEKPKFVILLLIVCDCIKFSTIAILFLMLMVSLRTLSLSSQILFISVLGDAFHNYSLSGNIVWGVIVGHLTALAVHSNRVIAHSVAALAATGKLSIESSLPVLMGANIGVATTCMWLALLRIKDPRHFRRSFAATMLQTKFALCNAVILLPLESLTGMLESLTNAIPDSTAPILPYLPLHPVDELANLLLQIDEVAWLNRITNPKEFAGLQQFQIVRHKCTIGNGTERCLHFFNLDLNSDVAIGIMVFILSLVLLIAACHFIVALLQSLSTNQYLRKVQFHVSDLNAKTTSLTTYGGILLITIATVIVGNTTTVIVFLMILVGWQCVTLQFAYPLILGVNVGAAILLVIDFVSVTHDYPHTKHAVQLAVSYLISNILGLLFLAIPFLQWPLYFAYRTGNLVSRYRWVVVPYILLFYYLLPLFLHLIAVYNLLAFGIILFLAFVITIIILVICHLQLASPRILPPVLRSWQFLPSWMRSLEKIDSIIKYPLKHIRNHMKVEPSLAEMVSDSVPFITTKPGDSISLVIDRINARYAKKTSMMFQYATDIAPNVQPSTQTVVPTVFLGPVKQKTTATPWMATSQPHVVTPVSPISSEYSQRSTFRNTPLSHESAAYSGIGTGLGTSANVPDKMHEPSVLSTPSTQSGKIQSQEIPSPNRDP